MNNPKNKIIIIGSGFGGLASAALLAKDGYEVTVIEKNEQPGGRASTLKEKGFRFDMGPSWYMMPEVFDRYFQEFGRKTSDYYKLISLKPQYRVFFGDKTHIDITGSIVEDKKMFDKLEPGFSQKFDSYIQESKQKYELSMNSILYRNLDSIFDLMSVDIMKAGVGMGIFEPMDSYVKKFFKHPKIQQILEYNLVFLGCSPKNAPALFSLMSHVDFNLGVWYPEGGIESVVQALVSLGKEYGVTYIYNTPVTQLLVNDKHISEVITNKKSYKADIVISNADYWFTENILSDQSKRTYSQTYWNKRTMTPSAFLLYLGVKGKLPKLQHHNLYFGDDWSKHFEDVFDAPKWPIDPSIYINKSSENDDTVAPKGHENLMVLVPVAAGLEDSNQWKEHYANYIVDFIDSKLQISLKKNIVYKKIFSVSDFQQRFNSYKGNALGGLAHTFFQSAIWRPKNTSSKIENLFFVGANTSPGIGVPPALISAHLVRERINRLK